MNINSKLLASTLMLLILASPIYAAEQNNSSLNNQPASLREFIAHKLSENGQTVILRNETGKKDNRIEVKSIEAMNFNYLSTANGHKPIISYAFDDSKNTYLKVSRGLFRKNIKLIGIAQNGEKKLLQYTKCDQFLKLNGVYLKLLLTVNDKNYELTNKAYCLD